MGNSIRVAEQPARRRLKIGASGPVSEKWIFRLTVGAISGILGVGDYENPGFAGRFSPSLDGLFLFSGAK
jgi:hypothetical protein